MFTKIQPEQIDLHTFVSDGTFLWTQGPSTVSGRWNPIYTGRVEIDGTLGFGSSWLDYQKISSTNKVTGTNGGGTKSYVLGGEVNITSGARALDFANIIVGGGTTRIDGGSYNGTFSSYEGRIHSGCKNSIIFGGYQSIIGSTSQTTVGSMSFRGVESDAYTQTTLLHNDAALFSFTGYKIFAGKGAVKVETNEPLTTNGLLVLNVGSGLVNSRLNVQNHLMVSGQPVVSNTHLINKYVDRSNNQVISGIKYFTGSEVRLSNIRMDTWGGNGVLYSAEDISNYFAPYLQIPSTMSGAIVGGDSVIQSFCNNTALWTDNPPIFGNNAFINKCWSVHDPTYLGITAAGSSTLVLGVNRSGIMKVRNSLILNEEAPAGGITPKVPLPTTDSSWPASESASNRTQVSGWIRWQRTSSTQTKIYLFNGVEWAMFSGVNNW